MGQHRAITQKLSTDSLELASKIGGGVLESDGVVAQGAENRLGDDDRAERPEVAPAAGSDRHQPAIRARGLEKHEERERRVADEIVDVARLEGLGATGLPLLEPCGDWILPDPEVGQQVAQRSILDLRKKRLGPTSILHSRR